MRGQISLELLFNFLIVLTVISSLTVVLLNFYEKVKKQEEIISGTIRAEEIARTDDMYASIGSYKILIEDVKYKIENDLVIMEYDGKTIIANTIFNKRESNAQHM